MKKITAGFAICALILQLCGCKSVNELPDSTTESDLSSLTTNESDIRSEEEITYLNPADYLPSTREYIDSVISEHLQKFETPGMSEYEKVKAATDYIISIGFYTLSPALDVWRWRSAGDYVPTYEEMRGLNMLLFGAETCEGYAGALNMLLNAMGIETRNIPGYTYAANGSLAYHTWSQVKIDGVWYHIDCDLEDDISTSSGIVRYKYFLKSDETMEKSHFWGQRLIDHGTMEPGQIEEIQAYYMGENCPSDYPAPEPKPIEPNSPVAIRALRNELRAELAEYEKIYGKLEWIELDVVPPVTIKYFLTAEEHTDMMFGQTITEFAKTYQNHRCVIKKPGTENEPDFFGRNPTNSDNSVNS